MVSKHIIFITLCPLCVVVWGQDFRASIGGQVTDPAKAPVPDAIVKTTNRQNAEVSETKTNTFGYYSIPFLNPGTYDIEVSAQGFHTLKQEGLVLTVADKLDLPFTLTLGQMNQEVTVTSQQDLIQTTSADRGLVFDPIKTQEYPLNGRQVYMLMGLVPGVIFTQEQFGANGFSGTRGWDVTGSFKINGGRPSTNQYLLNGAPISTFGTWQLSPNVEAIQEFKVQTGTFDSQFGRTGGGTVNIILKQAGSNWHGDLFEYFRNSVLDANTFQNNAQGQPRGIHNQHQFGGIVGGPVRKDKDFLFFSFEGWREVVPFPFVGSTPPMDIRDGQHFSTYGVNIFDPLTTRRCTPTDNCPTGVQYVRALFAGNVIPKDRISPIGVNILNLYPAPNGNPGQLQNNFLAAPNLGRYAYNQPIGRWDHEFGTRDRFYSVVTFQHGNEFRNNNGFPPPAQRGQITSERTDQNYIADWTHIFSSTTVLDMRGSFGRFTSFFPDGSNSYPFTYSQLGIKSMPIPPTVSRKTAPVIRLDLFPDIVGTSYSWNTDNQWDFAPSISQVRGKQTWHYGFEWSYIGRGAGGPGLATGRLDFNSRYWTQQYKERGFGQSDGNGVASLLLGLPTGGQIDYNDSYYRTQHYYAFFFQDDWKVRPHLTLNLGLRWDVQVPFVEQHNRVNSEFAFDTKNPLSDQIMPKWRQMKADWDSTHPGQEFLYPAPPSVIKGGMIFPGVDGKPRRIYDTDWTNLQPRFGLAWQFVSKTVLRAGFGVYHRPVGNSGLTNGFSRTTSYLRSLDGDFTPSAGLTGPYSLENPFPDGYQTPTGSALGLATNAGNSLSIDSRDLKTPRIYEWAIGIQRALPGNTVLDVSYAANRAVHEPVAQQWGNVSLADFTMGHQSPAYLNTALPNPFQNILPASTGFGTSSSINAYDLRRPYPIFPGVVINTNPVGKYWYDALQLSVEKKVLGTRGPGLLTFILSYTFDKSFEANHRLNDWNFAEPLIHELDNNDKPQSLAFSGIWNLPFGRGARFLSSRTTVVEGAVSDWSFDWIFTYYAGYPVGKPNAVYSCGDYRVKDQNFDHWFNNDKNCYSDYLPYSLRNVEDRFPNIRNPAEPQMNLAIQKKFRVTERYSFQLRAESFNVTNTAIFPGPNTDWRSPQFGKVTLSQQNFPRLIQLAAKFSF